MSKINLIAVVMFILCLAGCVSEFDVYKKEGAGFIIIDALVTDYDSIQTVYLRRDMEPVGSYVFPYDTIRDASVHIADDNGWSGDFVDVSKGKGREFELRGHKFEAGRTYTLTVTVGDRVFVSTETMVQPPIIKDNIDFWPIQVKEETWYGPIIYFKDSQPDEVNYYLFANGLTSYRVYSASRCALIHCLSDEGLRGDMEGVNLSLGIGYDPDLCGRQWGDHYVYDLYTISKRNYDYFCVLKDQVESDGGIYKPMPTSPVTNFSGKNVQGQFIAATKHVFEGVVFF